MRGRAIPSYISLVPAMLAVLSFNANGKTDSTPVEIRQLINAVAGSGCEFERNGERHQTPDAARHLESKLETAAKSWFAPAREKWTAEMFIEKIATGSSLSGDPYWIVCKDKPRVRSDSWMTEKLKDLRLNRPQ